MPNGPVPPKKIEPKIIGVAVAILVVVIVVIAIVGSSCSSSSGNQQPSQAASSTASSANAKHGGVSFSDITKMSDVELADALNDEGYSRSTNGSTTTFKKGNVRVDIDYANGWRGYYLESGDIETPMSQEGVDYKSYTVYKKSGAKDFIIGVCEVEGGDGLLLGAGKGAVICKPGYMEQAKKQVMKSAKIEYYMEADQAAVEVANALESQGFKYSSGDKLT